MFAMQIYPRMTSLCLKTDGKYKIAVVGPDAKCLQESARTVADLSFKLTLITALLEEDPTRIYIRKMLTNSRSPEKSDSILNARGKHTMSSSKESTVLRSNPVKALFLSGPLRQLMSM